MSSTQFATARCQHDRAWACTSYQASRTSVLKRPRGFFEIGNQRLESIQLPDFGGAKLLHGVDHRDLSWSEQNSDLR